MPRDIVLREGQGIPSESGTEACDREDRPATTGHQITRTATVNADGGPPRVLGHCPPAVRLTARQRQRLPRGGQAALRALRQALRRRRRKGNLYRYRYYVCFSRQRYGQATCAADRLPADELDRALLEALLVTLARSDLIERAAHNLVAQLDRYRDRHQAELAAIDAELRHLDQAIDRYMLTFEQGTLDPDRFNARLEELARSGKKLQRREESLQAVLARTETLPPAAPVLADFRANVRAAADIDEVAPKKALIGALVQDVEVRSRNEIYPTFRFPTAAELDGKVRKLSGSVPSTGFEPAAYCSGGSRSLPSATRACCC